MHCVTASHEITADSLTFPICVASGDGSWDRTGSPVVRYTYPNLHLMQSFMKFHVAVAGQSRQSKQILRAYNRVRRQMSEKSNTEENDLVSIHRSGSPEDLPQSRSPVRTLYSRYEKYHAVQDVDVLPYDPCTEDYTIGASHQYCRSMLCLDLFVAHCSLSERSDGPRSFACSREFGFYFVVYVLRSSVLRMVPD
jgi:hypothetical protein